LKKYTDKVELFQTTKPDIIFRNQDDNTYAIEVETGTKKDKGMIERKAKILNNRLGKNWFFVVTDKNVKKKYEYLGKTLTRFEVLNEIAKIFENSQFQPKIPKKKENLTLNNKQRSFPEDNFPNKSTLQTTQGGLANMKNKEENKKEEGEETKYADNKPIVEYNIRLSKDNKYLIHQTTLTTIKPVNFIKKVLEGV